MITQKWFRRPWLIGSVSVVFACLLVLTSCTSKPPPPPSPISTITDPSWPYPVPAILNEPSPVGTMPPMIVGTIELGPYRQAGNYRESEQFFLFEGETIDIVVSTTKQFVDLSTMSIDYVGFKLDGPGGSVNAPDYYIWDNGRRLYVNRITRSGGDIVQVTTAVRLIALQTGMHDIEFWNHDPASPAIVAYEVYQVGIVSNYLDYLAWLEEMEDLGLLPIQDTP